MDKNNNKLVVIVFFVVLCELNIGSDLQRISFAILCIHMS